MRPHQSIFPSVLVYSLNGQSSEDYFILLSFDFLYVVQIELLAVISLYSLQ